VTKCGVLSCMLPKSSRVCPQAIKLRNQIEYETAQDLTTEAAKKAAALEKDRAALEALKVIPQC